MERFKSLQKCYLFQMKHVTLKFTFESYFVKQYSYFVKQFLFPNRERKGARTHVTPNFNQSKITCEQSFLFIKFVNQNFERVFSLSVLSIEAQASVRLQTNTEIRPQSIHKKNTIDFTSNLQLCRRRQHFKRAIFSMIWKVCVSERQVSWVYNLVCIV